jgi:energy-coupling factor transport system ATP-binding protein
MVFQNPDNQLVATVVEEDVAFGPENLGVAPPQAIRLRVAAALEAVGMQDMARREPHLLSGGQKQRVAIAGILAMEPEIIVLDEATAMLDPSGRAEVLDTVRRLNREKGITIVHITHFMEEAALADRIFVMHEGRLAFSGTPREVFGRVADLRRMDLDVPQIAELADRLRAAGLDLPAGLLSAGELVEELCRLLLND